MNTVALIFRDAPSVIIPFEVAAEELRKLANCTLVHPDDVKLLAALMVGIGPMPSPQLGLMPDGRTRAETLIAEWRERYKDLNPQ